MENSLVVFDRSPAFSYVSLFKDELQNNAIELKTMYNPRINSFSLERIDQFRYIPMRETGC